MQKLNMRKIDYKKNSIDPKKLWKVINDTLHKKHKITHAIDDNNKMIEKSKEIANSVNKYYIQSNKDPW